MKISCLLIDDEPLALALLKNYAARVDFLDVKGCFSNAEDAQNAITTSPPDVIFTDIQMPGMSGLLLATQLPEQTRVIFTTAFEQYALESYKTQALDYLVKPFPYEDFLSAAKRAHEWHTLRQAATQAKQNAPEEHIMIKADYKLIRVPLNDILFIESLRDYVKIHRAANRPLIALMSLQGLLAQLPQPQFLRIHRSWIANLHKAEAVSSSAITIAGKKIPISGTYREAVMQEVGKQAIKQTNS